MRRAMRVKVLFHRSFRDIKFCDSPSPVQVAPYVDATRLAIVRKCNIPEDKRESVGKRISGSGWEGGEEATLFEVVKDMGESVNRASRAL